MRDQETEPEREEAIPWFRHEHSVHSPEMHHGTTTREHITEAEVREWERQRALRRAIEARRRMLNRTREREEARSLEPRRDGNCADPANR